MSNEYFIFFLCLLPIVAFLYSSVGHGGASGYLALMALFGVATETMKPTALLLNLFVAAISFYFYYKEGYFKPKLFIPFAIASIPAAFIGGTIQLDSSIYKKILAVFLLFAIARILFIGKNLQQNNSTKEIKIWLGLIVGFCIGFFSGLIGIGGGIILSPIIILMHWGNLKESAAVSALFIWVNSAAGLLGQFKAGYVVDTNAFIFVFLALIGGLLGAFLGSKKLKSRQLEYILSIVLFMASIKLWFT
ncbi:MAG: sulfite exporter TauE/SafE family protein [Chitinophagales bacterium]|nr:sulfite exporter TauE/SafE family protein [Bacteroidota bacterium]MCB9226924.1 sulfite exporter TauE/SafE family protein [Chitinophagales bacterium]